MRKLIVTAFTLHFIFTSNQSYAADGIFTSGDYGHWISINSRDRAVMRVIDEGAVLDITGGVMRGCRMIIYKEGGDGRFVPVIDPSHENYTCGIPSGVLIKRDEVGLNLEIVGSDTEVSSLNFVKVMPLVSSRAPVDQDIIGTKLGADIHDGTQLISRFFSGDVKLFKEQAALKRAVSVSFYSGVWGDIPNYLNSHERVFVVGAQARSPGATAEGAMIYGVYGEAVGSGSLYVARGISYRRGAGPKKEEFVQNINAKYGEYSQKQAENTYREKIYWHFPKVAESECTQAINRESPNFDFGYQEDFIGSTSGAISSKCNTSLMVETSTNENGNLDRVFMVLYSHDKILSSIAKAMEGETRSLFRRVKSTKTAIPAAPKL